ncbi:hypothetical protein QTP70_001133 [Hemibagrus guttatus]|uniref:Cadherin-like and PC-esterase domain-containing protein 1 n=1 Tax=Hemibagrus guttatus TaxID=175788 RepID=A0AAE0QBE4_9TELE|nr:hypothetical protein QTP70_001133 [Hemibagrus guttatus]
MYLGIGMLLRRVLGIGTLRRTWRTAPLVLVGLAVFLIYHTSVVSRTGFRPGQEDQKNKSRMRDRTVLLKHPKELVPVLEAWPDHNEVHWSKRSCAGKAIMLTGQHVPSDTEVQLYHRVLQEQGYHVKQGRYAETSATLTHSGGDGQEWSLLICLKGTEKSCLRKINFAHSQPHQRVNIIPAYVGAFMDMGGVCRFLTDSRLSGMSLPIIQSACTFSRPERGGTHHHTEHIWNQVPQSGSPAGQGPVASVNVFVLVTSAMPLTAFLHRSGLVRTHLDKHSHMTKLQSFFKDSLDPSGALQPFKLMKQVISEVLTAAVSTTDDSSSPPRCLLCFQLMTFTLHFNASVHPIVVKYKRHLSTTSNSQTPNSTMAKTKELSKDTRNKIVDLHQAGKTESAIALAIQTGLRSGIHTHQNQLYTDPPLVLTPLFNTWVKEYRAEVPFDIVAIRIRPEPVSSKCHVHLDEHRGPRTANYPLGLGNSRINILLLDESGEEPVVMTIYTLHIFRESRPSLPMFDEYVMCGFIQCNY